MRTNAEPGVGRRLDGYDGLVAEVPDGAQVGVRDVCARAVARRQLRQRLLRHAHCATHARLVRRQPAHLAPQSPRARRVAHQPARAAHACTTAHH